jgi:hypothetical protein
VTDLKLDAGDGSFVVIDGRVVKATASDFMLDSSSRHRADKPGFRRALVHDQGDGLTINYNRDYPGGVTINDVVALNNRFGGITVRDVIAIHGFEVSAANKVPNGGGAGADVGKKIPTLHLYGQILLELDPGVQGIGSKSTNSGPASKTIELQTMLTDLQNHIESLTKRVAELERRR